MNFAELSVTPIAWTHFDDESARLAFGTDWMTDGNDGERLIELAGRSCYRSWTKPNPVTATNQGYIANIIAQGHLSVLEHPSATFAISGASRSCTHELVRHRHLSYSQESQRFTGATGTALVPPPLLAGDEASMAILAALGAASADAYNALMERADAVLLDQGEERDARRRKITREAARAALLNATETRIIITGNYRAWRHFIAMRATAEADAEIRGLALAILERLQVIAPHVFSDYVLTMRNGVDVAVSRFQALDRAS